MAYVIVGCLITASALIYQALYVLRTGHTNWFFVRAVRLHVTLGKPARIMHALVYGFPGIGIMVILATSLARADSKRVLTWVMENYGMLFFCLCFMIIGLLYLAQPARMLRWTIRTNPEIADNKSAIIFARFIAVGLIGMAIAMLISLSR
jgi:hypothetical protein